MYGRKALFLNCFCIDIIFNSRCNSNKKLNITERIKLEEKIMKYSIYENNYGNDKPLTKNIKKIQNQINDSIYKEIHWTHQRYFDLQGLRTCFILPVRK